MNRFFARPWIKAYAGLFINFSPGYFALAFITPSFTNFPSLDSIGTLTLNILLGIVFLLLYIF